MEVDFGRLARFRPTGVMKMPDESGAVPLSQADAALRMAPAQMAAARRAAGPSEPLPGAPRAQVRTTGGPDGVQTSHIYVETPIEWLSPELRRRAGELSALTAEVQEKISLVLRTAGGGGIPAISMLTVRLQVLTEMLFPRDTRRGQAQYLDLEMRVQQKILDTLELAEDKLRQEQLAAGQNLSPDALERLARRMGIVPPEAEQKST
jgi:hypothetical protein